MASGQNMMIQFLKKFDKYPFLLKLEGKEYVIGTGKPRFTINLKKTLPITDLLTSTSLCLGEAYMRGDLDVEGDLYEALDYFLGQMDEFSTDQSALRKLIFTCGSKKSQMEEIAHHYDKGNEFYELWLDETMSYSCACFQSEGDSLADAQRYKTERILDKLCIKEGMRLLDIGCGWGYLLIAAAKKYKTKSLGITLSKEQQKACRERVAKEGLQEYITVELMDYRDLPKYGKFFDRVVSIGMLEHVGRVNYGVFVECVDKVLEQGGLFLLQFISSLTEHPGDPWMKKYIFPGGAIPSLREIEWALSARNFYTLDVESLRRHYNKTLLCWIRNFRESEEQIKEMFGEEFARMWDLYLCACAATFHNGIIDVHQILASKGVNNQLPLTRWY